MVLTTASLPAHADTVPHEADVNPEFVQLQHICYDQQVAAVPVSRSLRDITVGKSETEISQLPVEVTARNSEMSQQSDDALFSGGVEVRQGDRLLKSDRLRYNRTTGQLEAPGPFYLRNHGIELAGRDLKLNTEQERAELEDAYFQLISVPGRGTAKEMLFPNPTLAILDEATFSNCPPQQPSWKISARQLDLNRETGRGEAYRAWLHIRDTPILYLPYFNFPIDDRRQTGFLTPALEENSEDGIKLETPYYVNILPNLDLLITPQIMTDRGIKWDTETRYLLRHQQGTLLAEYMDDDREYDITSRYMVHWEHSASWMEHWRAKIEYFKASDSNYFNDLDTQKGSTTDTYLNRTAKIGYYHDNWFGSLRLQGFQSLGRTTGEDEDGNRTETSRKPYNMAPQFEYMWRQPNGLLGLDYMFYQEMVAFDAEKVESPDALRLHMEPSVSLPIATAYGKVVAEAKLLQTWYQQKLPLDGVEQETPEEEALVEDLEENVNRTHGQFRLYGSVNFERDLTLFDNPWLQTLEPEAQYLYVSKQNQNNIFSYDTTPFDFDYDGLFRPMAYTSLDRVASANQISFGLGSRLLDEATRERVTLHLGKIWELASREADGAKIDSQSALLGELRWKPHLDWLFRWSQQNNLNREETEKSDLRLTYFKDDSRLVELGYRFSRDVGDQQRLDDEKTNLEQVGGQFAWPLWKPGYRLFTGYWYNMRENWENEIIAGIQYDSCCWTMNIYWQREMNNILDEGSRDDRDRFDKKLKLQITLKGMGSERTPTRTLYEESIYTSDSEVTLFN